MTVAAGLGYTLVALGPAIALFGSVIVVRPFLILTLLTSALIWLISLIGVSVLWRAFLPATSSSPWLYAFILVSGVGVQEGVRLLLWEICKRAQEGLEMLAVKLAKPALVLSDNIQIALAAGLGHGVAHVMFFCVSLLVPAYGPATLYVEACPQMPFFLVLALTSLGFLLIHTFSMIVAFLGYSHSNKSLQLFPPGMHLLAALVTLVNTRSNGCVAAVPLIFSCALVTLLFCGKAVWDETGERAQPVPNNLERIPLTGL